jgi:hypothetical protein
MTDQPDEPQVFRIDFDSPLSTRAFSLARDLVDATFRSSFDDDAMISDALDRAVGWVMTPDRELTPEEEKQLCAQKAKYLLAVLAELMRPRQSSDALRGIRRAKK